MRNPRNAYYILYRHYDYLHLCLGSVYHDGFPTIILTNMNDVSLYQQGFSPTPVDEFERQADAAHWECANLALYTVIQSSTVSSFQGRVMTFDLEAITCLTGQNGDFARFKVTLRPQLQLLGD